MKKILFFLALLWVPSLCFADLYVIYKTATGEVYTVSEKDDTILPDGHAKVVLAGTPKDLFPQDHPTNYKYENGQFVRNMAKIAAEEEKKAAEDAEKQEEEQIQKRIRKVAMDQLKAEGATFKHAKE